MLQAQYRSQSRLQLLLIMQSRTWDCAISRHTDDRRDSTRQDEAAVHHLHGDRPPPVLHPEHTAGCPPPQRPRLSMKGQERAISRKKKDASPTPSPSASPAAIQCTVANGLCRNIGDFLQDCPSAGGSGRRGSHPKGKKNKKLHMLIGTRRHHCWG